MPPSEAGLGALRQEPPAGRGPDAAPARSGPTRAMPRVLLAIAAALLVARVVLGIVEGPRADSTPPELRIRRGGAIR